MRAILDDASFGEEAVVYSCNAELRRGHAGGEAGTEAYLFEAAGRGFFDRFERRDTSRTTAPSASKSDPESDEGEEEYDGKTGKDNRGGILKISPLLKGVELYPLLGVGEGASQEEIKKAYRAEALRSHPDKLGQLPDAEAKTVQENFVKIQEAYEILSDPAKRQLYDSSLPFDESLPKFKQGDGQDFYQVFSEVFARNARFSTKRPVPEIGGPETSMNEVKKFYDFWFRFQSWRDPLAMAQADGEELCDLEEAECREEKRWMMRENARIGKKYKQAEKDRVITLVSMAEKNDPRIRAEQEAKKAARAAEAQRREDERMAVQRAKEEQERKRREQEEAEKAAEAERKKQEKAVKDAAKAEVKKCRQRLRALHPAVQSLVLMDQLNEVCLQFEKPELQKLGDDVEAALKQKKEGKEAAVALIYAAIESLGLKPMPPKEEDSDKVSTSSDVASGPSETSHEESEESRRQEEERRQQAEKRRKEAEARRAKEEQQAAELRKIDAERAAEERKRREEQRRKEEAAAEVKRKQAEKKEKEKAKKAEEKKKKEEEQERVKREQQREEAKLRAQKQADDAKAAQAAQIAEREAERVMAIFEADRNERMDRLDAMSNDELKEELVVAVEEPSLAGALHLLRKATLPEEQRGDCLSTLICRIGLVWPLILNPPADVKPSNAVRNKAKKARTRLREFAVKFFASMKDSHGADKVSKVTELQRGYVEGKFEWPTWTLAEREAELASTSGAVAPAQVEEAGKAAPVEAEAPGATAGEDTAASTGKKGKKANQKKKEDGEDLDALLAEFGVSVEDKKSKKKKGGK